MAVVTAELSTGNTASQNGAAITAASASAGIGGGVVLPAGTFDCLEGQIERRITVSGPNTTLRHPDGTTAQHILANQLVGRTATTAAGSAAVVVNEPQWFQAGDLVAIAGAGVTYDATDMSHISIVLAVNGSTLTLQDAAVKSVTNQNITRGAGGWTLEGVTLDGNRGPTDSPNANVYPLNLTLCAGATIDSVTAHSGDHAGFFALSSWDNYFTDCESWDCGQPASKLGGALWLFGDSRRNVVRRYTVTGDCYEGITVDDRSSGVNVLDGQPVGNTITACTITTNARQYDTSAAIVVVGANETSVEGCAVSGADIGIAVAPGLQGTSRGNARTRVLGNLISDCGDGVLVYANTTKATIDANEFSGCTANITDQSTGTIIGTNTNAARLARAARISSAWSPR